MKGSLALLVSRIGTSITCFRRSGEVTSNLAVATPATSVLPPSINLRWLHSTALTTRSPSTGKSLLTYRPRKAKAPSYVRSMVAGMTISQGDPNRGRPTCDQRYGCLSPSRVHSSWASPANFILFLSRFRRRFHARHGLQNRDKRFSTR